MSDDLIWPSMARVNPGTIHESTIRDFEADSIRRQWETRKERLFCDDEDDMLVECGTISEKGRPKSRGKNGGWQLKKKKSLTRSTTGIDVCEFENYGDLETFLEVSANSKSS